MTRPDGVSEAVFNAQIAEQAARLELDEVKEAASAVFNQTIKEAKEKCLTLELARRIVRLEESVGALAREVLRSKGCEIE
tara:strand:- start:546 stop:785 length:240 start_codon:yes stop_codon:yes gene_type:complete